MKCRAECGACCIAISIGQPFHGMPDGKPAGVPCVHLGTGMTCDLYNDERRPALCEVFAPQLAYCGNNREQALARLAKLEVQTMPELSRGCGA